MNKKIAVIGLDCAEPTLVFERWKEHLPNLSKLMDSGVSAPLRSTDPPITIPAWTAMFSAKDPGTLGIYGFRNRRNYSYDDLTIAYADDVEEPRLWDYLTGAGLTSVVIGVPQTFPVKPLKGYMISGMLAEKINQRSVFPPPLISDIVKISPAYQFDVKNFRTEQREALLRKIYAMTRDRFRIARHLLDTRSWDLLILVEIGLDRIQHAFWQFMAEDSLEFDKNNRFRQVVFKYYQYLDFEIGTLLKRFDENTDIMIVSDHGAKSFQGGFCINQWLINQGYLKLKNSITGIQKLQPSMVDWQHTRVWAEGGYYARLFLNIRGREPCGTIPSPAADDFKKELEYQLSHIKSAAGKLLANKIHFPERLYKKQKGFPPDLMVYFDDLNLRAIGSVGWETVVTQKNDSGPDGANHDYHGIFILQGQGIRKQKLTEISIYEVAPTILKRLNLTVPAGLAGTALDL